MVAPGVLSLMTTLCNVLYVPAFTENAGAAACGGVDEPTLPLPPQPVSAAAAHSNMAIMRMGRFHVLLIE